MTKAKSTVEAGSQTLARGLTALAMIGEAETPPTVSQLAGQLGIHRSMAYRLVKTLEQLGFVEKTPTGELEIGLRAATLVRSAAKDLQSAATPHLTEAANELELTTFLVVYDGEAAVTLLNVEPLRPQTTLAQRPGSRHSIDKGAPGHVIRSQVHPNEYPPQRFEISHDEVISGITSIAVPLVIAGARPAAIAVLSGPNLTGQDRVVEALLETARRIAAAIA